MLRQSAWFQLTTLRIANGDVVMLISVHYRAQSLLVQQRPNLLGSFPYFVWPLDPQFNLVETPLAPNLPIYSMERSPADQLEQSFSRNTAASAVVNLTSQLSLVYSHQEITEEDILSARCSTSITFDHCTSKRWETMGDRLACLPQLQSLSFLHCITEDIVFWKLPLNKSLRQLRICTCLTT